MIYALTGNVEVGTFDEITNGYSTCCSMLRAGRGQELWTSMRMTYRAAAKALEKVILLMRPDEGYKIISEIRNEDY